MAVPPSTAFPRAVGTEALPLARAARNEVWITGIAAVATAVALCSGVAVGAVPVAAGLAVACLLPAIVIDARERRLPDVWSAAGGAVLMIAVPASLLVGASPALGSMLLGAAMLGGPLLVVHVVSPTAMGFGDVKAGAVLGAAAGNVDWRLALVALTLASGAAGAVGIARRARTIAFGPFLVVATAAVLVSDHVWLPGLVDGSGR